MPSIPGPNMQANTARSPANAELPPVSLPKPPSRQREQVGPALSLPLASDSLLLGCMLLCGKPQDALPLVRDSDAAFLYHVSLSASSL